MPRAGDNRRNFVLRKTANALEKRRDLFLLHRQLRFVRHVLVLAAAAVTEIATLRLDATFRRFDDFDEVGARETFLHLRDLGLDRLALDHQWHKHDESIHAPDPLTTKRHVVNAHCDLLACLRPGDFLFCGCGCSVAQNSFVLA